MANQKSDSISDTLDLDSVKDELFRALEKTGYFRRLRDGNIDQNQLDRATNLLHKAVEEMQRAGCQTFDQKSLAERFISQGNKDMWANHFPEAIELYTFAISLRDDNAVYYCKRAAAYTLSHGYAEAVQDCIKSIEINPNYSEAYIGWGFVYYFQGNCRDAIDIGFTKALQLDPNNDSVKYYIRIAELKLREEQQKGGPGQDQDRTREPLSPGFAIDKGFAKALQLDPNNDSVKENIRASVTEQKLREEQERGGPGQFKMAEEKENMMCRTFRLTIFGAKNLQNVRKVFDTRAYAKISIRSANGKTISRRTDADNHNRLNPAWDQAMEFEITASEELYYGFTVVIEVYTKRTFGTNGHIGEVRTTMKYLFDEASKQGGNAELSLPIVFTGEENPSDKCFLGFSCSFSEPKISDEKGNFMKKVFGLGGWITMNVAADVVADAI